MVNLRRSVSGLINVLLKLGLEDYKETLFNREIKIKSMNIIRSKKHEMKTCKKCENCHLVLIITLYLRWD